MAKSNICSNMLSKMLLKVTDKFPKTLQRLRGN